MNTIERVILSWPKHLASTLEVQQDGPRRSWIQLAKTGSFTSNRYGQFSITKGDLAQMLLNFESVTPASPTELPIDYDHLSMDPKKPGDGIAAGWMKRLQLRNDGSELWAEVEWTEPGAERIERGEYRFVSPSFVKDYTHKDGRKIGTTLIAAAITNHPFLEGMRALTLYSFSALGDLALTGPTAPPKAVHMATVGQWVQPDSEMTPELTAEECRQTFTVTASVGEGDDEFLRLACPDGRELGWFRATQVGPARAHESEQTTEDTMQDTMEERASRFARRVTELSETHSLRDALNRASTLDPDGAAAYRLAGVGAEQVEALVPTTAISLTAAVGEDFDALVLRYAHERGVSLRQAVHAVGEAYPDMAAARG